MGWSAHPEGSAGGVRGRTGSNAQCRWTSNALLGPCEARGQGVLGSSLGNGSDYALRRETRWEVTHRRIYRQELLERFNALSGACWGETCRDMEQAGNLHHKAGMQAESPHHKMKHCQWM